MDHGPLAARHTTEKGTIDGHGKWFHEMGHHREMVHLSVSGYYAWSGKYEIYVFLRRQCSRWDGPRSLAARHTADKGTIDGHGEWFHEMGRRREIVHLSVLVLFCMEWKIRRWRVLKAMALQSKRAMGHLQHGILLRWGQWTDTATGSTRCDWFHEMRRHRVVAGRVKLLKPGQYYYRAETFHHRVPCYLKL